MMYIYIYFKTIHLVGLQSSKVLSILHSGGFPTFQIVPSISPKRSTDSTRKNGKNLQFKAPRFQDLKSLFFFSYFSYSSFFCLNKNQATFLHYHLGDPDSYLATQVLDFSHLNGGDRVQFFPISGAEHFNHGQPIVVRPFVVSDLSLRKGRRLFGRGGKVGKTQRFCESWENDGSWVGDGYS